MGTSTEAPIARIGVPAFAREVPKLDVEVDKGRPGDLTEQEVAHPRAQIDVKNLARLYIKSTEAGNEAGAAKILDDAKGQGIQEILFDSISRQVVEQPAEAQDRVISHTLGLIPKYGSGLMTRIMVDLQEVTPPVWDLVNENWQELDLDGRSKAALLVHALRSNVADFVVRFARSVYVHKEPLDPQFIQTVQDLISRQEPSTQAYLLWGVSHAFPEASLELARGVLQLDNPNPVVRREAARALSLAREAEAIKLLEELLDDEDESVRAEAVIALRALGDWGFREVIPVLGHFAEQCRGSLRVLVLEVLALLPYPEMRELLAQFLESPDTELRRFAAGVLQEWAQESVPT